VPSVLRRLRRAGPAVALSLVVLLSGVSLWQAWQVSVHLRSEARESSRIFGQVIAALSDPEPGEATELLLELVTRIRETGLPVVVTDSSGRATIAANTPFDTATVDAAGLRAYVRELDRTNPPITIEGMWQVHFGSLPMRRQLGWLGILQLALLVSAIVAGVWAFRSAIHRDRDRLWVAMARESAHQLGTPLMSAAAWVERLAEEGTIGDDVASHLRADLERLERVAQRFERIGRPARRDRVALGALAERVKAYFAPRLPRHAHRVTIRVDAPDAGPVIAGDPVLLEWAVEALVRNAVDALSGRGGTIDIHVQDAGGDARITVTDDGPGIPPDLRGRIFEPGVTTKAGGWGIGLALARRIVEEVHDGRLSLGAVSEGAEFVIELPKVST